MESLVFIIRTDSRETIWIYNIFMTVFGNFLFLSIFSQNGCARVKTSCSWCIPVVFFHVHLQSERWSCNYLLVSLASFQSKEEYNHNVVVWRRGAAADRSCMGVHHTKHEFDKIQPTADRQTELPSVHWCIGLPYLQLCCIFAQNPDRLLESI